MRWLFVFIFFGIFAYADESVQTFSPSSDLVWNKWDTDNFIVLSIDKSQGLYLKENIESIKHDFENKWGIKNLKLSTPCKLICVPDNKLLNKLFNIDESRSEIRRDSDGKILVSAIWTDFENADFSYLISPIILDNSNNSFFIKKGIAKLEDSLLNLRSDFSKTESIDFKKIIYTTENSFSKMSLEEKNNFVKCSALACLLLRREFGIKKFSSFVESAQKEAEIKSIFGFENIDSFSDTLNRYAKNLAEDLKNNKTPDNYLKSK